MVERDYLDAYTHAYKLACFGPITHVRVRSSEGQHVRAVCGMAGEAAGGPLLA